MVELIQIWGKNLQSYKKRSKIGWQDGKSYKKESNDSERMYAKKEILEAEVELIQGDEFKTKGKVKGKKTKEEKIQKEIAWLERAITKWSGRDVGSGPMIQSLLSSFKAQIENLKKKLEQ